MKKVIIFALLIGLTFRLFAQEESDIRKYQVSYNVSPYLVFSLSGNDNIPEHSILFKRRFKKYNLRVNIGYKPFVKNLDYYYNGITYVSDTSFITKNVYQDNSYALNFKIGLERKFKVKNGNFFIGIDFISGYSIFRNRYNYKLYSKYPGIFNSPDVSCCTVNGEKYYQTQQLDYMAPNTKQPYNNVEKLRFGLSGVFGYEIKIFNNFTAAAYLNPEIYAEKVVKQDFYDESGTYFTLPKYPEADFNFGWINVFLGYNFGK